MKAVLLFLFSFFLIALTTFSCKKEASDNPIQPNKRDTIYIRDTIRIHDTVMSPQPTRLAILTAKTWQVDELIHVISSQISHYVRGGINNTGINYDIMRFIFKGDGSGTTIQANGITYPLTWQFTGPDQRNIQLTVNSTTYTWNLVEISGNYLHASSPLLIAGNPNNLESFRLIQIQTL